MALTVRQTKLYTDTVSIFKPDATGGSVNGTTKVTADPTWSSLATGVAGKRFTVTEFDRVSAIGRAGSVVQSSSHRFHFQASQEVQAGYCLKLTTPSHPEVNTFYMVLGDPEIRVSSGGRTPNYRRVYVQKVAKPPSGVS